MLVRENNANPRKSMLWLGFALGFSVVFGMGCRAVFLGAASSEPVGDYFAGTNHVLPTNGAARYASSLGVADFVKTTGVIAYSQTRLRDTHFNIALLARSEGLEAHARAVEIRCEKE